MEMKRINKVSIVLDDAEMYAHNLKQQTCSDMFKASFDLIEAYKAGME